MEIELWFLLPLGIRLIVGVGLAKVLRSYGKVIAFIVYKKVPLIHKDCLFSLNFAGLSITKLPYLLNCGSPSLIGNGKDQDNNYFFSNNHSKCY